VIRVAHYRHKNEVIFFFCFFSLTISFLVCVLSRGMCFVHEESGITTDRQTREIECIGSVCIYVKTETTFVVTDNTYFVLLFCSCFLLVSVCEKIIHGEFDCTVVAQEGHRERKDRLFV
jgi:hypothetical protein